MTILLRFLHVSVAWTNYVIIKCSKPSSRQKSKSRTKDVELPGNHVSSELCKGSVTTGIIRGGCYYYHEADEMRRKQET